MAKVRAEVVSTQPPTTGLLREWMERTGASAADAARVGGLHESVVSRWLSGEKVPRFSSIEHIIATTADDIAALRPKRGRPLHTEDKHAATAQHRAECAALVARAMKSRKLKPLDMVEMFGVTRPTVSRWLSGKYAPPEEVLTWARVVTNAEEAMP